MQTDKQFLDRQVKSARDRRIAGARMALTNLQRNVEASLKALDKGDKPNIDITVAAIRAQQALVELEAIDEIVALYELPPSDEEGTPRA